jgi:hypothetical protein
MWVLVVILPYHYQNVGEKRPMTEKEEETRKIVVAVTGNP